jgi:hypothetical protein
MSSNNFDKKIKDKLYEHESDYDSGAWKKFKPLLPTPWYTTLFQNYGGWLFGGLATSALLFTFFYQNNKNSLLNDEISTLKKELASISNNDTIFIEKTLRDTVYLTEVVEKYKYVQVPSKEIVSKGNFEEYLVKNPTEYRNTSQPISSQNSMEEKAIIAKSINPKDSKIIDKEKELSVEQQELIEPNSTSTGKETDKFASNKAPDEAEITEVAEVESKEIADAFQESAPEEIVAKSTPEKEKKKINLPQMRVGIGSDYLGLNVLTNGINAEVFLTDKLSFNTGVLFSGIVETKHPLANDFNRKTGKQFQEEFRKYNPRIPDQIKDINIRTSFIKLPINLNYYINTWSRFNFIISAGTNLDLSVYQDIDFSSGLLSNQIKSRFEARPKAKVFNSFNYGMGVQYQYGHIVGQLTPYFDFRFRDADYFTPKNKFGLSAALKYEF